MYIKFPFVDLYGKIDQVGLEVELVKGLPELKILGIPSKDSQIARERIRTAIKKSRFKLQSTLRKIINFSCINNSILPQAYDFQIIASLLYLSDQLNIPNFEKYLFIGEVFLDGKITCPFSAKQILQIQTLFPEKIIVVPNIIGLENSQNLIFINKIVDLHNFASVIKNSENTIKAGKNLNLLDLKKDTSNQTNLKFDNILNSGFSKLALLYSLRGAKHLILFGSTGVGKTMLFDSLTELSIKSTNIYSIDPTFTVKQFKNIVSNAVQNKSTSYFILSELADFSRPLLDYLKIFFDQENNIVVLATANPCYCGNRYSSIRVCKCNPYQIKQYDKKLSLPLLDRFDMVVNLNDPELNSMIYPEMTRKDFLEMYFRPIKYKDLELDLSATYFLSLAVDQFGFSARRQNKIESLSKIIADLAEQTIVTDKTMASALQYQNYFYAIT